MTSRAPVSITACLASFQDEPYAVVDQTNESEVVLGLGFEAACILIVLSRDLKMEPLLKPAKASMSGYKLEKIPKCFALTRGLDRFSVNAFGKDTRLGEEVFAAAVLGNSESLRNQKRNLDGFLKLRLLYNALISSTFICMLPMKLAEFPSDYFPP
ncbi:hypothetical protein BDQ17DRAFT_1331341 [Cyathus striatus]|nr:hypothetical protein BDQ17DRAFT_1331341 [Cyathus striatus]